MQPSEEIMQFLKDNPTFYLATVDGYLPRVRPIGFAMWYKDHQIGRASCRERV